MANGVLKYRKYQDQRKGVPSSGKWYGRAVQDRTVEFADFVTHMALPKTRVLARRKAVAVCWGNILPTPPPLAAGVTVAPRSLFTCSSLHKKNDLL